MNLNLEVVDPVKTTLFCLVLGAVMIVGVVIFFIHDLVWMWPKYGRRSTFFFARN